jgi:hypothetical protein
MNLNVPWKVENFLPRWVICSYSRRTLLCGVCHKKVKHFESYSTETIVYSWNSHASLTTWPQNEYTMPQYCQAPCVFTCSWYKDVACTSWLVKLNHLSQHATHNILKSQNSITFHCPKACHWQDAYHYVTTCSTSYTPTTITRHLDHRSLVWKDYSFNDAVQSL